MRQVHDSRTGQALLIAFCAVSALLCASCATGAKSESEKKSPEELAQLYTELGTQALLRNETPQAIEDLRKAQTLNPKNAVAANHLGLAYYSLGQKKAALDEVKKAVTLDPQYSDAYVNLGSFAMDTKEYRLARHYYTKALENLEYKTRHRALTNLAQLELAENNSEEARKLLYQSIQANPDYCLSHFLLGSIFMRERNPNRAATEFKRSVQNSCTGNVEAHYQLGLAYLQARDFAKAKSEFVLLVDQYPQTLQGQKAGDQLKNIP